MKTALLAAGLAATLALLAAPACKKELEDVSRAPRPVTDPAPAPKKAAPAQPEPPVPVAPAQPAAPAQPTGPVQAKRTVLDAEVRQVWKSVEFVLREKKPNTEPRTVTIPIGGEAPVPGTPLTIRVVGFVPEFAMDAGTVTTKSMSDVNPAAKIKVIDEAKGEIWEGWAFRNYPDQHSFQDPRYAILMTKALKE